MLINLRVIIISMVKKIIFFLLIPILFLSTAKADVGIGIRWGLEEIFLNEFEEKCIFYSVYNPFDTEVTAEVTVEKEIALLVTKIEPKQVYLPAYSGDPKDNAAKLANKEDIKICFYANPFRWPPFYPLNYTGVILASAMPGKITGSGSAAVSVVQAPLTVRVGSIRSFYIFIVVLSLITITLIILVLAMKKKLPKKKKKFCPNCKEEYSYSISFCPKCGNKLEEKTPESNLKYLENKNLINGT